MAGGRENEGAKSMGLGRGWDGWGKEGMRGFQKKIKLGEATQALVGTAVPVDTPSYRCPLCGRTTSYALWSKARPLPTPPF